MSKRYFGGRISASKPNTSTSSVSGGIYNLVDQAQAKFAGQWPSNFGGKGFTISPAFNGKTSWDFDVDGALNMTTGSYTLTSTSTFNCSVKMWGQGGYNDTGYSAGAGGALVGTLVISSGDSLFINFGGAGTGGNPGSTAGDGGKYSGIFYGTSATHANTIAIAAGGGGCTMDDGGRGGSGGAGGYPAGSGGGGYPGTNSGGGTQSAGGSGSPSYGGSAGSALQGGSGTGGPGCNGGGGGGGYYGGGGGGCLCCQAGSGGGGGSNYHTPNTARIANVTHYSGSGTTAGNPSDSNRGGAGDVNGNSGRIYIVAV